MAASNSYKKMIKRDQILSAAEKLFSEKNYGNTQISEIAQNAGVGVGTFYRYFQDKESVLLELLATLMEDVRSELANIRKGIEDFSPIEHITLFRRTFEVVFQELLSKPQLSLIFLRSGYGANGRVSDLVWEGLNLIAKDIVEDIALVEKTGIIEIPDKETICHSIIGMILQLIHRIIIEGKPEIENAVNICMRTTLGIFGSFIPEEKFDEMAPVYRMLMPPVPAARAITKEENK